MLSVSCRARVGWGVGRSKKTVSSTTSAGFCCCHRFSQSFDAENNKTLFALLRAALLPHALFSSLMPPLSACRNETYFNAGIMALWEIESSEWAKSSTMARAKPKKKQANVSKAFELPFSMPFYGCFYTFFRPLLASLRVFLQNSNRAHDSYTTKGKKSTHKTEKCERARRRKKNVFIHARCGVCFSCLQETAKIRSRSVRLPAKYSQWTARAWPRSLSVIN